MFSYHPMTFIRACFLLFVAAEMFMVAALLIAGIAALFSVAARGAIYVYSLLPSAL